eukprot:427348_1
MSMATHNDPLAKLLTKYGWYDDLYDVLSTNDIDLEILENDTTFEEVEQFCKEFGLSLAQKYKFRKLLRIIKPADSSTNVSEYRAKKQRMEFARKKSMTVDYKMTLILVGDSNAGKTCLISKYVDGTYSQNTASTFGVPSEFITIEELSNNEAIEIKIYDTAGQERFHSLSRKYYNRGHGVLLCYDVSIESPFKNFEMWRKAIKDHGKDNAVVIIVGCKKDLAVNDDICQANISKAENIIQQRKWQELGAMHCICSAKTGHNIRSVFLTAAESVLKKNQQPQKKTNKEQHKRKTGKVYNVENRLSSYHEIVSRADKIDHDSLTITLSENNDKSNCYCSIGGAKLPGFGRLW